MTRKKTLAICLMRTSIIVLLMIVSFIVGARSVEPEVKETVVQAPAPEPEIVTLIKYVDVPYEPVVEDDSNFQTDRDIIATVVYNEAWGGCSERHRELVAAVVVNRVNDSRFPNTVYDVVTQPNQYLKAYADPNSTYRQRATSDPQVWAECQRIAARALHGEIECDPAVVWQAESTQGTGTYETHRTSYSTTYFCY